MMKIFIQFILLLIVQQSLFSQKRDSIPIVKDSFPQVFDSARYNDTQVVKTQLGKDSTVKRKVRPPRAATIRSAIFPGLGQIYNRKYWKLPIVYAAIGIPAYLFFNNKKQYNNARYALTVVLNNSGEDSILKVDPILRQAVRDKSTASLLNYRNQVRRDMDMSILVTVVMWGLNIVDATVDAHLRDFDVSDDVTLRVEPTIISGTRTAGLSFVFNFK